MQRWTFPALGNGDLIRDLSAGTLDTLHDKGLIFAIKEVGLSGTYFNDCPAAVVATDAYAYLPSTRTIDKAVRGVRSSVLPTLKGPLVVNSDGTLTEASLALLSSRTRAPLEEMVTDEEISSFQVNIDPDQDVVTSSEVEIGVEVVEVATGRTIEVKIGLVAALTG